MTGVTALVGAAGLDDAPEIRIRAAFRQIRAQPIEIGAKGIAREPLSQAGPDPLKHIESSHLSQPEVP